jgi:dGTPase
VVERVENEGKGLNLTWEVRDGILHHTGSVPPATLEARIVKICDRVAYVNHDIDDALRAGLLREEELPPGPIALLGRTNSERIDTLVHDLVDTSDLAGDIVQGSQVGQAMDQLRTFLFSTVYARSVEGETGEWVRLLLAGLLEYFLARPQELPGTLAAQIPGPNARAEAAASEQHDRLAVVVDYVAGMTDRFAEKSWREISEGRTASTA